MAIRDLLAKQAETKLKLREIHNAAGEASLSGDAEVEWKKQEAHLADLDLRIERQAKLDEWDKHSEPVAEVTPDGDDFEMQCRTFSFQKLIGHQIGAKGVDAGKEIELSAELQKRSGKTYQGMAAPTSALCKRAASDYTTTKPTGGPAIVAPDFRPEMYVDLLRNASVLGQLPVTNISGLKGTITYPRAKSGITGAWVAEDAAAGHETMTWEQSTIGPMKWASTICQFGRQAMLSSALGLEGLIRADFAAALSRLVDSAFLAKTTSNAPNGITNANNSVDYSASVPDTNGLKLSWANFRAIKLAPQLKNLVGGNGSFLTSPKALDFYEQELKAGGRNGYVVENGVVAGQSVVTSNAVSDAGTKGTGSNLSTIIYGLWDNLLVATADDLDIMTNPYATDAFDRGAVQVRAMMAMDWAVRHEDAFYTFENAISQ